MLFFFGLLINIYNVASTCNDCYNMGTHENHEVFICPKTPTQNININININIPQLKDNVYISESIKDDKISKNMTKQNNTIFEKTPSLQHILTPSSSSSLPFYLTPSPSFLSPSTNKLRVLTPSITPSPSFSISSPSFSTPSSSIRKPIKNNLRGIVNDTNITNVFVEEIVDQYLNKTNPVIYKEKDIALVVGLSVTITIFIFSLIVLIIYKIKFKSKVHNKEKVDTGKELTKNKKISKLPTHVNKRVVNKRVDNKPVVNKSVVNKPVVNKPVANKPVVNKSTVNKPVSKRKQKPQLVIKSPGLLILEEEKKD